MCALHQKTTAQNINCLQQKKIHRIALKTKKRQPYMAFVQSGRILVVGDLEGQGARKGVIW